jgi:hypothetical protein
MLTASAIRLGIGTINWSAATECAAWDNADYIREACEAVSGPDEQQVREKALAMLASGTANFDDTMRLADRVHALLIDAAAQLIADEAQELLDRQREEEFEAADALRSRKLEACEAIRAALGRRVEQTNDGYSGFGSMYFVYRSRSGYGYTVDIRVSDHTQVAGGGWNEGTGDRHGESDVSFVIDSVDCELPTRSEIRDAVANALRTARE